jgi:hypothetical protein
MMRAFVTEAIGDSISLPVKLLLRTAYNHARRKTLTLTIRLFSCSSASIDTIIAVPTLHVRYRGKADVPQLGHDFRF